MIVRARALLGYMQDDDTANVKSLIDELATWAASARLREFTPGEIVSALTAAGLVGLSGAGVTHEQAVDIVAYHYGKGVHLTTRPRAQA